MNGYSGINDQNFNNSVIITRNTNSFASETRDDDGMMEIYHLHQELVSEHTLRYRINRKHHDLIQRQFNTLSAATENRIPIPTTSYRTEGFVNPNDLDQEFKQANNRQERQHILTRITQKIKPKSTYRKLPTQYNIRHCSALRHNVATSYENWQPQGGFCARTRRKDK